MTEHNHLYYQNTNSNILIPNLIPGHALSSDLKAKEMTYDKYAKRGLNFEQG